MLVAAASLLATSASVPRELIAAVFGLAALLAVLSIFANTTGHTYYRSTRDLKKRIEEELELGEFALTTTPGMGSLRQRVGRVKTFLTIMLLALATTDVGGCAFSLVKALEATPAPRVELFVRVHVRGPRASGEVPIVLSSGDRPVASATSALDQLVKLKAPPGTYRLSSYSRAPCSIAIRLTRSALQVADLIC